MVNELIIKEEDTPTQQNNDVIITGTPTEIIEESTHIANILKDVINKQKLYTTIQGNKYVNVEGWTTLSSILQLVPLITSCERLAREDEIIYEAYCEVYTSNNRLVGKASAICSDKERNWKNRDEYAIRSMAQTRAISKALRMPLGWIMTLADFSPTPAEEMDGVAAKSIPKKPPKPKSKPTSPKNNEVKHPNKPLPPKQEVPTETVTNTSNDDEGNADEGDWTLTPDLEQAGRQIGMIDRIYENCEIEGKARPTYKDLLDMITRRTRAKDRDKALEWLESIK